ncbi:MAG: hypothetical protein WCG51_00325, partial [Elusimicrobiota bacterium]
PLWGVFGAASACGALAMLILGSGTNLIVHMQIEYVITKNFLMAVKQYGNARLHHGVVDYTVFVVNTPPANINDLNPVSVIKLDGGQQVWGMISPAGQVILYSEASPEQVTRAISERARNEGIMGDAHLQRCLRELFSDAVAQWPASIEKNAMSEAIGHAVLDTAVRVEMGTTGKRMRYDDDGTMVLTGDISDSRASARAISNGDAVAMANSALLYLNDGFDAEKTVQALFRLNGKQVVVDGVEKTVRVQAMLSKKSHMQIYAMIPAGTDDFVNQEIQKAFKTGVAGCVVRHGPDFIVIDFATATPATWATDGVPADLIAVNKDVNQLKNAFRSSRTPCHIVDVSNITKQIEATRDLADKQAFIDILGAGILSLFGAQSYSARYVNDAVYGFSDDQLTEDTKTAYLSKMHADLQDSARYMTLEVVFERAWAQRLLYTQWIVDHEYAFPVPLHHRQMIGRALALVGDKRAQVTGNAVLDSTPVDEASINAKYHAVTQNSSPQAVSELITMIQLFDLQFTDIGSRIAQPQDVRMLSAILSAA